MSKSGQKWWSWLLKIVFSLGAFAWIGYKLFQPWEVNGEKVPSFEVLGQFAPQGAWFLLPAFLLVVLNLGLEARKWQVLVRVVYPELNFKTTLKAVLTGMTTGIFTPNRIGEYAGRVMYLEAGHRIEATLLTFLDRISQMFVTLLTGGMALLIMLLNYRDALVEEVLGGEAAFHFLLIILTALILGIALVAFNPAWIGKALNRLPQKWEWAGKSADSLKKVGRGKMLSVLGLAILRYLTFSSQYILLMYGFGYEGGVSLALGMTSLVFLLKSLVPFVGLSELGVRESAAMAVMELFGVHPAIAFSATLVLYFINILFPSLTGVIFLVGMRIRFKKDEA